MNRLVICACVFPWLPVCAQQTEVANYGVDQGLPQSMVNHVLQDSTGFIWFGTGDGLARFDGSRFTVYKHEAADTASLSNNSIWGLGDAGNGKIWVGTRRGLDLLDRNTGRFKHIRTGPSGDLDGCWVPKGTFSGSSLFYSPLTAQFLVLRNGQPERIPTHHQGSYAMAPALPGGLQQFLVRPDSLITFGLLHGDAGMQQLPVHAGERVTCILRTGDHWLILTDLGGFLWKDGQGRTPVPAPLSEELQHGPGIKLAARDPAGQPWLAITHAGVFRLNDRLEILASYRFDQEDRPFAFTLITFDHQGNTWVGTDGQGAFRIAPQRIKFGRCMPGISSGWSPKSWFVRGFAQWDSHRVLVWFHESGPALFDERDASLHPLHLPGAAQSLRSVLQVKQDKDGIIWLRTHAIILAIDPRSGGTVYRLDAPPGVTLLKDGQGAMLALSAKSLHRCHLSGGLIVQEPVPAIGLGDLIDSTGRGPSRLFMDPQKRIWAQFADGSVQVVALGADHPKAILGLGEETMLTDLCPGGTDTLWGTTTNGLYAWRASTLHQLLHITRADGLADEHLYGLLHGPKGMIWTTSNNGLARYDPATGTIRNFGPQDGLQSREFNTDALFTSASGHWYIGGINGFNYFRPEEVRADPDVPQVAIVSVTAQNQPWAMGPDSTLVLPYRTNMVEIALAVLEQSAPALNSYRYRLAGFDDAWHTAPAERPILFTRLPAGQYNLEVAGINADGVASVPKQLLRIRVPIPFWASTWFIIALTTACIALIAWLINRRSRMRLRRKLELKEQELKELRMRTRLAKDIHDDVGSGLARMAAITRSPKRSLDAEARFEKLGSISGELMDNLRDVVWMNDPRNGTLHALLLRIREHANDLFEDTQLAFLFPELPRDRMIGGIFRRNLFLIAKEALQNAHKYSAATQIMVEWRSDADSFSFQVSDNGIGMKEGEVKGSGNGTLNMQQRASEMHAKFERISAPGAGTTVRVSGESPCLNG